MSASISGQIFRCFGPGFNESAGSKYPASRCTNREGRTVIMVTHDESTAEYADRTVRIQDGRIA